jgi:hypothetical protein
VSKDDRLMGSSIIVGSLWGKCQDAVVHGDKSNSP